MQSAPRRLAIGVLLSGLCALWACGAPDGGAGQNPWQKDLDHLAEVIRAKHKNPFHRVSEETFNAEVAGFRTRIPTLTHEEILVGLVRIGAMIGDGHTAVRPYDRFDVYPLKLFRFEEGLRVTGTPPEHAEVLGWTITRIGTMDIAEATKAVEGMTPQGENRFLVVGWNGYWLKNPQVLHVLGVTESGDRASYTFRSDAGEERTLTLTAVDNDEYSRINWESVYQPLPEFMQSRDEAIQLRSLSEGKTLYVSFRSYPSRGEMKKVATQTRERIREDGVHTLIVDFRGNGGGDFKKGLHLIKEIAKTGIQDNGRVFALTDRWTFSAAMSNAAHCRQQLNAVIVGEPAGERPNGYAENYAFTLPNSGIEASCSSRYYEFQDEDTPTLQPDHAITPDFLAWSQGRDPVLEWLLEP